MSKFYDRLAELGFSSYEDYLQSDHWKVFKARFRRSGIPKRCVVCNVKKIELHHHTYERLGSERLTDVIPLCRDHHHEVHLWLEANRMPVQQSMKSVKEIRKRIEAEENRPVIQPIVKPQPVHQNRPVHKPDPNKERNGIVKGCNTMASKIIGVIPKHLHGQYSKTANGYRDALDMKSLDKMYREMVARFQPRKPKRPKKNRRGSGQPGLYQSQYRARFEEIKRKHRMEIFRNAQKDKPCA